MKDEIYLSGDKLQEAFSLLIEDPESSDFIKSLGAEMFVEYIKDPETRKTTGIRYDSQEDTYLFNENSYYSFINYVVTQEANKEIMGLVSSGKVDIYWDDEKKDFIFKPTSKFEEDDEQDL